MIEGLRAPTYSEAFKERIANFVEGDSASRSDAVTLELSVRLGYALDFLIACQEYFPIGGQRFLEIGSGSGNVATAAVAMGADVTAIDIMQECLDLTELRLEEHGFSATIFRHDIREPAPSLAPGTYDFVFCYQVLEHLPRDGQFHALKNLFDLVSPGGHLFIDTENALCAFDRHDTQLWMPRVLREGYLLSLAKTFGRSLNYYEPSFGRTIDLHEYLTYDEIVGAAAVMGFEVRNAFMPHRDSRQFARAMTGSDWLYDEVLKYFAFEKFSPVALLLQKRR
ncbi:MAG TPA: methyltransferase domain-containing protein [Caulobacteraceae bacterium]|jgi:2-polyprenyl-3-methyl-5-hydroxy-6-metoxy-1,4-benzoquinol methylase|nr:methyltransferase domain-containing protein [Caulobacteraceae bacterium]